MSPCRRLAAAARRALAFTVLLAVGAGAVEIHGADGRHQREGPEEVVLACSGDHGPATHVEAARTVERHECAACLHRLLGRGAAPHAVAAVAPAAGDEPLSPAAPAASPLPPLDRAPSRGPPLA